ncbi:uncharacterized protein LOC141815619 [Curcuma longa]|uniref:uncharacterized protein LOC141815619 n=1 Tax=Curcuma longa TaxID=136217 RepID=UPI003D9E7BCB
MNCNWLRRGSSATAAADDDDWAMAKAAAWAWYNRSGADDARASPEFDLGRFIRRPPPPPSRYKQEATAANTVGAAVDEVGPTGVAVPLLDLYEIERITRQLERLIGDGGWTRRKEAAEVTASPSPPSPSTPSMTPTRRKAGRKWACHAAGICGAAGDAVAAAPLVARRRGKAVR